MGSSKSSMTTVCTSSLVGEQELTWPSVARVHWFRSSAIWQRWAEEVKLLTEEMSRTVSFFGHYRKLWMGYADEDEREGRDGGAAYARK